MSFTIKQLEAFVWIADIGSFRGAAERLNTTQPNISARIAALESALNVSLMTRDAGSVRLTAKGRDLLEHARAILRQTDALIAASGELGLYDGALRLGVTEMIMHTWLRDFMRAFREEFPKISVELTVDMSARLEEDLFSHRIDLALQNGPFSRSATGTAALGRYPLIWVASPNLDLATDRPLTVDDMARHPILTHARGTRQHEEVLAHFRAERSNAHLVPSSNLAAGKQMAVDSMGVAALPAAMVSKELASNALRQLNYSWQPDDLDFVARYDAHTAGLYVQRAANLASQVALTYQRNAPLY
ncbi:LysR family transcriptional regulator [Phaeobacter sp. 22II1-1F12B]|uniref:LysR family transcriptional regulator n=1 Tax=Phaeobacter sp. 22II1-1F12B TaxID=1317111 RepID=UPI000B5247E5|nr:LysR family transcriptional regulator [Phaeobacter sp. 22II1-1F12B]OWU79218.1 LysR family transcriptional regulator [Phaeobacter sp. 22II1-1F12B]